MRWVSLGFLGARGLLGDLGAFRVEGVVGMPALTLRVLLGLCETFSLQDSFAVID